MTPLRNLLDVLIALGLSALLAAVFWVALPRRLFEPIALCCLFACASMVFAFQVAMGIRDGKIGLKSSTYYRAEAPGSFWFGVAMYGASCVFSVFAAIFALFAKL